MKDWGDLGKPIRREVHFGDRVVNCFAERPKSYFEMVQAAARRNGSGDALIFGAQRWTWAELMRDALRVANGLLRSGVRPKDRIAALVSNRPEFILTFFACARIGAILVPLNPREEKGMLAYLLKHCGAMAIVHDCSLAASLPSREAAPDLRLRICPEACEGSSLFSSLYAQGEVNAQVPTEEDVLTINYTSGTTGVPKGVPLSHMGIIHAAMHYSHGVGMTERDRSVLSVPLNFTGGVVSALSPIVHCAGAIVLMPEFKASNFLRIAAAEKMTHTLMVPTMYELCLRQPDLDQCDLSSWRHGVFGAAPMPMATIERLARVFPNLRLMNSYGATEAGGPATFMRPEDTAANPDAVGQAFPCVELTVMDDDGRELPLGEAGELWIRSPGCASGFWNDPERSRSEYFGGYWRTGDIAFMREDGLVRLVDRKKDMINRAGYKVFSAQVEDVLNAHPAILEAAVVGKPDPVLGERVQAFVWSGENQTDERELREFCAKRLPDYKVPEIFVFTDEPLPRNPNGKILKRALRESLGT
jgi:long-chain acyl-CoA synthetase